MTAITDTKLWDKLMKEKRLDLKKTIKGLNRTHTKERIEKTQYRKL